jgi:hypothetical protein
MDDLGPAHGGGSDIRCPKLRGLEQAHFFSVQLRTVDRLEQMETREVIYAGAIKLEAYNEPGEGKWPVGYSAKVRGFLFRGWLDSRLSAALNRTEIEIWWASERP